MQLHFAPLGTGSGWTELAMPSGSWQPRPDEQTLGFRSEPPLMAETWFQLGVSLGF